MIKTKEELNLKVQKARLLTRDELSEFEDQIPSVSMGCSWWLADKDDYDDVAYAEGNYTDDDMYCAKDEPNTWIRVALDIEGDASAGDEFVYCGYVFTALSDNLAISNNFLGCAKYLDEEMLPYVEDDSEESTIFVILDTLLQKDEQTGSVEVFNTVDEDSIAKLGVLDLED